MLSAAAKDGHKSEGFVTTKWWAVFRRRRNKHSGQVFTPPPTYWRHSEAETEGLAANMEGGGSKYLHKLCIGLTQGVNPYTTCVVATKYLNDPRGHLNTLICRHKFWTKSKNLGDILCRHKGGGSNPPAAHLGPHEV